MKLFGHDTSPYTRRVRVLLDELRITFERDTSGWRVASEEMLRLNPLMRVPVLLDSGAAQLILDSKLMAAYLYECSAAPPSQAEPAGPHPPLQATLFRPDHRYDDENVVLVIDGAADSLVNVFSLEQDGILPSASPYLRRQLRRTERSLTWLEARYEGRTTLADGAFSFADIALVCALDWMIFRDRYDVSRHPGLCRVLEQHRSRPSLARTHPGLASV